MANRQLDHLYNRLSDLYNEIIIRLFIPSGIIHPSTLSATISDKENSIFETARMYYYRGDFKKALETFQDLRSSLENHQSWLRKIIICNEAACEIVLGNNEIIVDMIGSMYAVGNLYGKPLWNLALAYYHLGKNKEASAAIRAWLAHDTETDHPRYIKGELIMACLDLINGDEADARQYLTKVYNKDAQFLYTQLHENQPKLPTPTSKKTEKTNGQQNLHSISDIPTELREQLLPLMLPKRPDRDPALSIYLPREDIERYTKAIEMLAEGENELSLKEFKGLQESFPQVRLLYVALATALIFNGDYLEACNKLLDLERSGYILNGAALWNLGCAQARLGNLDGALSAFQKCVQTEYRTKPQLLTALSLLEKRAEKNKTSDKRAIKVTHKPTDLYDTLPTTVQEARLEILRRIIQPKKLAHLYRPDLGRLAQKDRLNASSALDSASHSSTAEAAQILLPLVQQYPDVYTLKVHTAAYLLLAGDQNQAKYLYQQAETIRRLDNVSRYNFAYIYLQQNSLEKMWRILEDGCEMTLADDSSFWLALSVARALTGQADSSGAAARAISQANKANVGRINNVLDAVRISPRAITSTIDPMLEAAQKARHCLLSHDILGAVAILENVKPSYDLVPEIGSQALEPCFFQRPARIWEPKYSQNYQNAVYLYKEGKYSEAVNAFSSLFDTHREKSVAINLTAACIKDGQLRRAKLVIRSLLRSMRGRHISDIHSDNIWHWRIIYNMALILVRSGQIGSAIQTVQQYKYLHPKNLIGLLIIICDDSTNPENRDILAASLGELCSFVTQPSNQLLIALSWALLTKSRPVVADAQRSLINIIERGQKGLSPAAEVRAMTQVRDAYLQFKQTGRFTEAIGYLTTIVESRSQERQSVGQLHHSPRELEQSIGVELVARQYLVRALLDLNERERAIRELDQTESFLKDNASFLATGFAVRDWIEMARLAMDANLFWTALRYCQQGNMIEPDNNDILQIKNQIAPQTSIETCQKLATNAKNLLNMYQNGSTQFGDVKSLFFSEAPFLADTLQNLLDILIHPDNNIDLEELCDRVSSLARLELPETAQIVVEELVSAIIQARGGSDLHITIEIDAFDERIWPRMDDDRDGSCLLIIASRKDIKNLVLRDPTSGHLIWEGNLKAGKVEYVRYTFYREEGFTAGSMIDLPLLGSVTDGGGRSEFNTIVNVTVGTSDPSLPSFPTGALSPEEVPGGELYGRLQLIRTIIRSLGEQRSSATYFLQAPRQMGKTSLLLFVRKLVPNYVLPVYVNLETKPWSRRFSQNIWNLMIKRLREEITGEIITDFEDDCDVSDLKKEVVEVCTRLEKRYVLFLIDEFHFLFERCIDPGSVMAFFREFLNIRENHISLLLADRYTRDELKKDNPSEYWAQLTLYAMGPLDRASTHQAIEYPTRGKDLRFLPETIDYLYEMTGGYPYHVQRTAQFIVEQMLNKGPWVTALPLDVDYALDQMLDDDSLFNSGLCRPERIDSQMFEAVAALLEWKDLCESLPMLIESTKDASDSLKKWRPTPEAFLSNQTHLMNRLRNIGVLKMDREDFFSPLLERWLRKMRRLKKSISNDSDASHWHVYSSTDGSRLTAVEWQNLDADLVTRTKARGKSPLKDRSSNTVLWNNMVYEVTSLESFKIFIDAVFQLFIDDREERDIMLQYPWLFLACSRMRLIRNYWIHTGEPTKASKMVWNTVCTQSLGGERSAYVPVTSSEWHAIQLTMLRWLYAGIKNSIDLSNLTQ